MSVMLKLLAVSLYDVRKIDLTILWCLERVIDFFSVDNCALHSWENAKA